MIDGNCYLLLGYDGTHCEPARILETGSGEEPMWKLSHFFDATVCNKRGAQQRLRGNPGRKGMQHLRKKLFLSYIRAAMWSYAADRWVSWLVYAIQNQTIGKRLTSGRGLTSGQYGRGLTSGQ
jgi:hypothetical protein